MKKEYSIGLYEKAMPDTLSWKEKFLAARDAGYDFVEISIDASEAKIARVYMSKEERLEIVKAMYETGMPLHTMNMSSLTKYSLGNDKPEYVARGMDILERAIELAGDLGVRIVMIPGYDVFYEPSDYETKKRYLENLKTAVKWAEKAGVVLAFETMENEFMNTVEKAMKYVTLVNSPYLKIYPDSGNLTNAAVNYQNDVIEDFELGRGHVAALHLKETVPGKFREIPYGTGHVDFEAMIEKAWDMGVRKFVTEFWYTGNPEWRNDLDDAVAMFTKILDETAENAK
jgi:L-ribulose-5-phosphate 3-epimerase